MSEIDCEDDGLYYLDPYEELLEECNYAYCVGFDHGASDYIEGHEPCPNPPGSWIDPCGYEDGYWDGYERQRSRMF